MKLHGLAELGTLRAVLRRAEQDWAEQAAREREHDARRQEPEHHGLFARSVGPVHALRDRRLADLQRPLPAPHPRQRELDEQAAVRESMSDEVTLESLLLTDDGLSFRRPGIGPDVVARLRRGQWALQGQLDLHGYQRDEARELVAEFIREAQRRGLRCVRVVHGKGHGSPGRASVLKVRVKRWLAQRAEVLAFAQASGPMGGAGALIVLLASPPR
jgi:DNA-nicking Smr family endonuclease